MSTRRLIYLTGVGFLALLFSSPQIWFAAIIGVEYVQHQNWPLPSFPGMDGVMQYRSELSDAPLWEDQFVKLEYSSHIQNGPVSNFEWKVLLLDPETGETKEPGWKLNGGSGFTPMAVGDRLWFIGSSESYELVDGTLRASKLSYPTFDGQFVLEGKLAKIENVYGVWILSVLESDTWNRKSEVYLPARLPDGTEPPSGPNQMKVFRQGDKLHVFLRMGGQLLYREGLDMGDLDPSLDPSTRADPRFTSFDLPASALRAVNTDQAIAGWSQIRNEPGPQDPWHPLLIGGKPALLITDGNHMGNPIAQIYRFDGTAWSLVTTHSFPFGSNYFHAVTRRDEQKSYLVVSTSLGRGSVYVVDESGIEPLKVDLMKNWSNPIFQELLFYVFLPTATLVLGVLLGIATWFWMWLFTKPAYSFGVQSVRLASLGWRGLAKLIDLSLLLGTTIGLAWLLTRHINWTDVGEAWNLQVEHSSVDAFSSAMLLTIAWIITVVVGGVVVQAIWGVTPGKWCCGLRTRQTTLKPCGIARSLLREVLMCVDCCNLYCWTPGILLIALTERRQRLGDLLADTIVVEAKSLRTTSQ